MLLRYRRFLLLLLFGVAGWKGSGQCVVTITTQPSCSGPCTGTLVVTLSAGCSAGPYEIFVTNGACASEAADLSTSGLNGPATYSVTDACACALSNYQLIVFDNSFNVVASQNINFLANPITITNNSVLPKCNASCDGTISGNIFGSSPFNVSVLPATLTPSSFTTNLAYSLNNLCPGPYTLNVTDASGCATSVTRTLQAPSAINPHPFTQSITCNGFSTGGFSVAPTDGTPGPGYTVVFSTGPTFNNVASGQTVGIANLPPGPVSATITDANNCSVVTGTTITQPSTINVVPTQTNINCGGQCIGVASVAVSGGGGSYSYAWSASTSTNSSASGLCAGQHVVTITDNFNCVVPHTFSITQPTSITITQTITNVTCFGDCTGAASISVVSGPPGTITFTWLAPPSGSVISTTSVISGRCADTYTLLASATTTCVNEFHIPITQPTTGISVSAVTTSVNCIGLCNGSATASVFGGNGPPFTYTWTAATPPPGPQNGSTAAGLCADNYTLAVRDASNCPASTIFNITEPTPFSFNVTTTSVNCNGACTGIVNASPSGGSAPYSYTLVSATATLTNGSGIFSNLCAGNYSLRVTDASPACPQQTTLSIAQPNPLLGSVNVTTISCSNLCNGVLAGSANGGVSGYTLSWSTPTGNVNSGVISNLCPGSYTFNVRDANGCNAPPSVVTLTAPPAHTVNIGVTNASCFGDCNGSLSATVSGGAPGYTLTWSTGFTGNPLLNRCAGNYTLNVTDANGCVSTANATVTSPSSITVTQTLVATACAGSCDGTASLTASGGVGPYTYQLGATTNSTGVFTNLCSGNYAVLVRDASNCQRPVAFSITSPVALSAAITSTRNSCTSCTGGATVTPSNGTPPYTGFAWTNSLNVNVGNTAGVNNLCPGNYTVTVTDNRSCTSTATVNVSMIVIVTVLNGGTGNQCFGACTASAVASASGGQGPYSFSWLPGSQTSATATGLCFGNYTVNVTDSGNPACMNSATINVPQPADITVNSSFTNVTCFNSCNGAISLSVTGGTGAKSFLWSPGGMNTASISGLCQGIYQATITDANGCSKVRSFTLAPPNPSVAPNIAASNPLNCNNPNTGTICTNPSGGNGTYSYNWSPGASTASCITNVPAGTYSLFITSGACTQTFVTVLSNPAGPTLTQLNLQNVACFGGSNGAATYSASGAGPFTFTWTPAMSPTTGATTSSVSGLTSGTYVVASTDAGNNCVTTRTFFVSQPSTVTPNGSVTNIQCNGGPGCNGAISVAPSGGTPPYTYTWSPGGNSATVTNVCAGTHTLNLRDNNNCLSTYTFNVTTPSSITITSTVTNVRCNSACNGSVIANASGGTGAITYSWLPQAGFSGSTTATIMNLCPGTYTLLARDANNCVTTHTVMITEPPALTSTLTVQNVNCSSACNGSASLSASGGALPYNFSWTTGTATTAFVTGLCAGNYTGTVVDANGCVSSNGFTITSPTIFSLSLVPTHPLCNNACNGSIQTSVSGAQGTVAFVWSPAGAGQNPVNLCQATYTVNAADANGCQAQAVITLTNPPALLANVTTTNSICSSVCSGAALSTPVNAQGSVSYSWTPPGPNAPSITGLCAGTYSLSIADANGCTFSQTFAITEPSPLNIAVSSAPATCGSNNGTITATPVGGTPSYTFAWTSPVPPPIVTTGSVATNLSAGIYTVSVVDANGCTNTVTIPLSNSNGPTAPITSTNIQCNAFCTGAASVGAISGGTSPYATPVWVIPAPQVTAVAMFSLCAGAYSVQLTDANNCVTFTGTSISEPAPISIVPATSLPKCAGVCDGTITVSASGGVAPYTFTWLPANTSGSVLVNACAGDHTVIVGYNGGCESQHVVNIAPQTSITIGPPVIASNRCYGECAGSATVNVLSTSGGTASFIWNDGQTGPVASQLCNGTYSVSVTDQQGCTDDFTVGITGSPQMSVNAITTQPDCGLCNGSSTVSVSGGTGSSYTFSWTNGSSGMVTSNLCAGLYQVAVTDSLNCRHTANITVNSSSGITGENVQETDASCEGLCDGSATVTAIGGTAPVSYNWINTGVVNTSNTASLLCADIYFVKMTDARGCARTASVQIDASTVLTVTAMSSPPACSATNGSIVVQVSGGTAPYSFNWLPGGGNTATVSGLGAGSYTVTVTDANGTGCSRTQVISLSNPEGPPFAATQTNVACAGDCSGAITLNSILLPPPTYTWSNGSNADAVTGLCNGPVSVTVAANGCVSIRNFNIDTNNPFNAGVHLIASGCFGECNGEVDILATGGSLPYSVSWTPATYTGLSIDSLCPGTYSATITDAKGCPASAAATVAGAPQIVVTSTVTDATCGSVPDGTISLDVAGGSPDFSYQWQGPAGFTSTLQSLENLVPGTYSLSIIDSLGCAFDTLLTVVPGLTVEALAGPDRTVCPGEAVTFDGSASPGSVSYSWQTVSGAGGSTTPTFVILPAVQNETLYLTVAASNTLCFDTDTAMVLVYDIPYLEAGPSHTMPVYSSAAIGGNPTADPPFTVTWTPSYGLDDPNALNPVASNTFDVTYTVTIMYGNGCLVSDSVLVALYPEILITSGFSPNDDGRNDRWIIDYIDQFPENTVEIYNRWGELLFHSDGYTTPFDGTFRGNKLPVGTYYYVIILNHPAYPKPYTGPLTIFR